MTRGGFRRPGRLTNAAHQGKGPLQFAAPDAWGLAVTMALQNVAAPIRVVRCLGQGRDVRVQCYGAPLWPMARELFVEHVEAHSTTAPDFVVYPGVRYGSHLENFSS